MRKKHRSRKGMNAKQVLQNVYLDLSSERQIGNSKRYFLDINIDVLKANSSQLAAVYFHLVSITYFNTESNTTGSHWVPDVIMYSTDMINHSYLHLAFLFSSKFNILDQAVIKDVYKNVNYIVTDVNVHTSIGVVSIYWNNNCMCLCLCPYLYFCVYLCLCFCCFYSLARALQRDVWCFRPADFNHKSSIIQARVGNLRLDPSARVLLEG